MHTYTGMCNGVLNYRIGLTALGEIKKNEREKEREKVHKKERKLELGRESIHLYNIRLPFYLKRDNIMAFSHASLVVVPD